MKVALKPGRRPYDLLKVLRPLRKSQDRRVAVDNGDKSGLQNVKITENQAKKLKLYPNPTNGDVNLEIEGKAEWYRVYDRMGRLVMQGNSFKDTLKISTSGLSSGIYRIMLLSDNGTESSTFEIIK